MKVNIGGTEWTVIRSTPTTHPELEDHEGLTVYDRHEILVNTDKVPTDRFPAVLFHELMHAAGEISGASHVLEKWLDVENFDDVEEILIRTYGQAMFDTLTRNGWLTRM